MAAQARRLWRRLQPSPGPRRWAFRFVAGGMLLAAAGFAFVWLGFAPISARSQHWPATRWFLEFAMRNAVETRSVGLEPPPLDRHALVVKGGTHYASGCAPCHGAPGERRWPIVRGMLPEPPVLAGRVHEWSPRELFWIVKNGLKYTAMPAWPAPKRDDEIWAMVAFLRKLPGLDASRYATLVGSRTDHADAGHAHVPQQSASPAGSNPGASAGMGPPGLLLDCARCHGKDGMGRAHGAIPVLAGQSAAYLADSLRAFATGERHSGIMQPVAAALEEARLQELAAHYAAMPLPPRQHDGETDAAERGCAIAHVGDPERGVPSCADCHGPSSGRRNPHYPRLAGQHADYLALQLELFAEGKRGGGPYAHVMQLVASQLEKRQMHDAAAYYASLAATERGAASADDPCRSDQRS